MARFSRGTVPGEPASADCQSERTIHGETSPAPPQPAAPQSAPPAPAELHGAGGNPDEPASPAPVQSASPAPAAESPTALPAESGLDSGETRRFLAAAAQSECRGRGRVSRAGDDRGVHPAHGADVLHG